MHRSSVPTVAGAVAKQRLGDLRHDGAQSVLRFQEEGGKSREIPVRHDLEGFILAYVDAAGIASEAKDSPLFRASNGRSRMLTAKPLRIERICELVKRRLKDAGLPSRLSPHSFRVTAITSLLARDIRASLITPHKSDGHRQNDTDDRGQAPQISNSELTLMNIFTD